MSNLKEFGQIAIKMSKSPIGIIGLMLVLVYGILGCVSTSSVFQSEERYILTLFLVLFPVLVLLVFFRLVTKHHSKLYAPSDYTNESNFVNLINNQIENSPKIIEIESIMNQVKEQINNQPLYKYTKLRESGKLIALLTFTHGTLDLNKLRDERGFDQSDINSQTEKLIEYNWITIKEKIAVISDIGKEEISTFEDLAYGRMR